MFEKEINHYNEHGWAIIKNVFSKGWMDDMRAMAWKAFRQAPDSCIQWFDETYPALLFGPKGLTKFTKDEGVVRIYREFLGDNILQLNDQLYFRLPGDGDSFNWHQDITFRTPPEKFSQIESAYLQTIIVIDDFEEDNSPIHFVDRSHTWPDMKLIPTDNSELGLRDHPDMDRFNKVTPLPKSGDVMVWSVMSAHGSTPNKSNRSRMYYMQGLAKASAVKTKDFPWYLKDGVVV